MNTVSINWVLAKQCLDRDVDGHERASGCWLNCSCFVLSMSNQQFMKSSEHYDCLIEAFPFHHAILMSQYHHMSIDVALMAMAAAKGDQWIRGSCYHLPASLSKIKQQVRNAMIAQLACIEYMACNCQLWQTFDFQPSQYCPARPRYASHSLAPFGCYRWTGIVTRPAFFSSWQPFFDFELFYLH